MKITYEDVMEYQHLFTMAPAFVLEGMARSNSNLVSKFKSTIKKYMGNLNSEQKNKLNIILASDIDDLQEVMNEAYIKTGKRQYKVLANPKHKTFIHKNLNEIKDIYM